MKTKLFPFPKARPRQICRQEQLQALQKTKQSCFLTAHSQKCKQLLLLKQRKVHSEILNSGQNSLKPCTAKQEPPPMQAKYPLVSAHMHYRKIPFHLQGFARNDNECKHHRGELQIYRKSLHIRKQKKH